MSALVKIMTAALAVIVAVCLLALGALYLRWGGGAYLRDMSTAPLLGETALEVVANLDFPPGNIAVAGSGRVFFTFHPDANPSLRVAELVKGKPVPYPDASYLLKNKDGHYYTTVLSLRVDSRNRLWTLDHGNHGTDRPRLYAFDLATDTLVYEYEFPSGVAGFGSMMNDLQIDPKAEFMYIADTSIVANSPAILVLDIAAKKCRRLLASHPSFMATNHRMRIDDRDIALFGAIPLKINLDSIALDRQGKTLYFGPLTGDTMYRIDTVSLRDATLSADALAARVEKYAAKSHSDGMTTDNAGNLYLGDMERYAIHVIRPGGKLETLVKSPRLRWPDGFSFGPGGWLYVSCSALQHVIFRDEAHVRANAPYQIFRLRAEAPGVPGQ